MKPTKLLPVVCLMGSLLLTGCASTNNDGEASKAGDQSQEVAPKSALSFLNNGQIRFDIMDNLGISFKYGDNAISSAQPLNLVKDAAVTFSGELSAESVNFIVYSESKGNDKFVCAYHPEVLKDSVAEFLQSFATDYLNDYVEGKAYVAISNGASAGKWTKGLSEELDKALQQKIDVFKK